MRQIWISVELSICFGAETQRRENRLLISSLSRGQLFKCLHPASIIKGTGIQSQETWNCSCLFFQNIFFSHFSRQNLLYIKAGIKCNVQQWREEAVKWVGPRERAAETFQRKPSKEYVVCSFGLFVGLMWQHEKRLVVSELFCQDEELHEWCLCCLLNWH